MNNIIQMVKTNNLVQAALILLGVYLLMHFYKQHEGLTNDAALAPAESTQAPAQASAVAGAQQQPAAQAPVVQADDQQKQIDQIVAGKDQLSAGDLLPKYDDANEFAKENPVSKLLKEQNFLVSGYHMGINTVMQSNKIPYYDLRSAPPIPKESVSPFLNSSYEQPMGANRRKLLD